MFCFCNVLNNVLRLWRVRTTFAAAKLLLILQPTNTLALFLAFPSPIQCFIAAPPVNDNRHPLLYATKDVVYTEPLFNNFLAFIDHMSCSADTYVSLGGSNGCADQLTNWDGTQKIGLGAPNKRK